eukprot:g300.t1
MNTPASTKTEVRSPLDDVGEMHFLNRQLAGLLHPTDSFRESVLLKRAHAGLKRSCESTTVDSVGLGRNILQINRSLRLKAQIPPSVRRDIVRMLLTLALSDKVALGQQTKAFQCATELLKKKIPALERGKDALTIDWRILYRKLEAVQFCDDEPRAPLGAAKLQGSYRSALVKFIGRARRYFSVAEVSDMIREFGVENRCDFLRSLLRSQGMLFLFLPNRGGISVEQERVDRWMRDWSRVSHSPEWDLHWFFVFDRVAKWCGNSVKWDHLVPSLFAHILDTLCLPTVVGNAPKQRTWHASLRVFLPGAHPGVCKMKRAAKLVVRLLDVPGTLAQLILFFRAVRTFFHPSNSGNWNGSLGVFLGTVCTSLAKRVAREAADRSIIAERIGARGDGKNVKASWSRKSIDVKTQRAVVDAALPLLFLSLYSKAQSLVRSATQSLRALASFAPEIVASRTLPRMYAALGSSAINSAHQAPSALLALKALVPVLVVPGRPHLMLASLPDLLPATLPAIDPADTFKTCTAVQFYYYLLQYVRISAEEEEDVVEPEVAAAAATRTADSKGSDPVARQPQRRDNDEFAAYELAFEDEEESFAPAAAAVGGRKKKPRLASDATDSIRRASAALREWAPQFLRRVVALFDSYSARSSSAGGFGGQMESMQSFTLRRTLRVFFRSMTPKFRSSMFELAQSMLIPRGGVRPLVNAMSDVGHLVAAMAESDPPEACRLFLKPAFRALRETSSNTTVRWWWAVVGGAVRRSGRCLLEYREGLLEAFDSVFRPPKGTSIDHDVLKATGRALRHLLRALLSHYVVEGSHGGSEAIVRDAVRSSTWTDTFDATTWHVTSEAEASFAGELLSRHLVKPMVILKTTIDAAKSCEPTIPTTLRHDSRVWKSLLMEIRCALRGALSALPHGRDRDSVSSSDPEGADVAAESSDPELAVHLAIRSPQAASVTKGLRLQVLQFGREASHYLCHVGSDDTKSAKTLVKIFNRVLCDAGGGDRVKLASSMSLNSYTRRSFTSVAKRAYYRQKLLRRAEASAVEHANDVDAAAFDGTGRVDGHCGHCYFSPMHLWTERLELQHRARTVDYVFRSARDAFFGQWGRDSGEIEIRSSYELRDRRWKNVRIAHDEESAVDDLLALSAHGYSTVRKKAQAVAINALARRPWLIRARAKRAMEDLADGGCTRTYETARAAVHFLGNKTIVRRIAREPFLASQAMRTICGGTTELFACLSSEERKEKIKQGLYAVFALLQANWRVLNTRRLLSRSKSDEGSRTSSPVENAISNRCVKEENDDDESKVSIVARTIDQLLQGAWYETSGNRVLSAGNSDRESDFPPALSPSSHSSGSQKDSYWRRQMLTSASVHVLAFNGRGACCETFWKWWVFCLSSDVVPVRAQAIAVLHSLLPLIRQKSHAKSLPLKSDTFGLPDSLRQSMRSESFCEVLCDALAEDHKLGVRGADGQVRRGGKEQWSNGVQELVSAAKEISRRNSPIFPKTRTPTISWHFQKRHVLLVDVMLREDFGGRALLENLASRILNLVNDKEDAGEDRRRYRVAAAEIFCGILIAAENAETHASLGAKTIKTILPAFFEAIRNTTAGFTAEWEDAVRYFAAKACSASDTPGPILVALQRGILKRLRAALVASEFSSSSKLLRLVQALLLEFRVHRKRWKSRIDWNAHFSKLRAEVLELCAENIDHAFKSGREEIGRTLAFVCSKRVCDRSDDGGGLQSHLPRSLAALVKDTAVEACRMQKVDKNAGDGEEKEMNASSSVESGESHSKKGTNRLHRKIETCIYWLLHAIGNGDSDDYVSVIPLFFPIVCSSTRCGNIEVEALAKHALKVVSRYVRSACFRGHDDTERHHSEVQESLVLMCEDLVGADTSKWHARANVLTFVASFRAYNLFTLTPDQDKRLKNLIIRSLKDERPEVQVAATKHLAGFMSTMDVDYLEQHVAKFKKSASKRVPKVSKNDCAMEKKRNAALQRRHAGLRGLSSIVRAYPYSLPPFMPKVLVEIAKHLGDPDALMKTAQESLTEFKRTHQDTWHQLAQKFTQSEWESITDALVSPHYYA